MNKDLKILSIIIITLSLMFATTLLLDLPIVKANIIRQIIVYILIFLQFLIGFATVKQQLIQ